MAKKLALAALAGLVLAAHPLYAEDRALVIGNENYSDGADIPGAREALNASIALRAAGFTVIDGRDLATPALRSRLSAQLRVLRPEDRLILLLAGHFAQSDGQTWFLGTDASAPDLANIDAAGISLATVMEIAARVPGGAIVLLGTENRRLPLATGLRQGIGPLVPPQGVAVVQGDARAVSGFASATLTARGASLASLLRGRSDLSAIGFLPQTMPFRPAEGGADAAPVVAPPPVSTGQTVIERAAEDQAWAAARRTGTEASFRAYLDRYPSGRFAALARSEIARIQNDPQARAEAAEAALNLSRDQRRTIQRQLSLLGFDPRGIDGLFGRGSRTAILAWQRRTGYAETGYLDRDQIVSLTAQADRRAAELEREAAERKAEQDRQDRIYWRSTGAAGDEAGLRAYLKRFPDGLFAEVATERLSVYEEERRRQAAAQDRAAWDLANQNNTIASYRDYLARFPNGVFAAEAQGRVEALEAEASGGPDRERAKAAEEALGLNRLARRLIEVRLEDLGLNPGQVDGEFDDRTRRAIRRFQNSRGQPPTGYLDQSAVVALLAGSILQFGD
jgi:peptidoglycan hydrolase-like protein with peptidoglycan-binding domain